jgi:hypothetical protein
MAFNEQQKREYFKKLYTEDPAKHYVRLHGWLDNAIVRLREIRSEARRSTDFINYFTFPGEYAVDVFLFGENGVISVNQAGYPSVVYCEQQKETVSIINKKLGRCRAVFSYSFEETVSTNNFQRCCPFDVINLDLTKEIFPIRQSAESQTIRAIERLLALHAGRDFDLYLTFKSSQTEINAEAVREFVQMINDNFQQNNTFEAEFQRSVGMTAEQLQQRKPTLFWCKSFPKWLFETGLTHDLGGELKGEFIYKRIPFRGLQYDVITFAFTFRRCKGGLMGKHRIKMATENEIRKTFQNNPFDVDQFLRENTAEKHRLIEDAKRLSNLPSKIAAA